MALLPKTEPRKFHFSVKTRRISSVTIGLLLFLVEIAPELTHLPKDFPGLLELGFYFMLLTGAPILCVFIGVKGFRFIEGFGWFLHLLGLGMMF